MVANKVHLVDASVVFISTQSTNCVAALTPAFELVPAASLKQLVVRFLGRGCPFLLYGSELLNVSAHISDLSGAELKAGMHVHAEDGSLASSGLDTAWTTKYAHL